MKNKNSSFLNNYNLFFRYLPYFPIWLLGIAMIAIAMFKTFTITDDTPVHISGDTSQMCQQSCAKLDSCIQEKFKERYTSFSKQVISGCNVKCPKYLKEVTACNKLIDNCETYFNCLAGQLH